jgi:hypothetical protein
VTRPPRARGAVRARGGRPPANHTQSVRHHSSGRPPANEETTVRAVSLRHRSGRPSGERRNNVPSQLWWAAVGGMRPCAPHHRPPFRNPPPVLLPRLCLYDSNTRSLRLCARQAPTSSGSTPSRTSATSALRCCA